MCRYKVLLSIFIHTVKQVPQLLCVPRRDEFIYILGRDGKSRVQGP